MYIHVYYDIMSNIKLLPSGDNKADRWILTYQNSVKWGWTAIQVNGSEWLIVPSPDDCMPNSSIYFNKSACWE